MNPQKKVMTPEAQEAQRILESATIKRAFCLMRQTCYDDIETLEDCDLNDIKLMLKCISKLEKSIDTIIRAGTSYEEVQSQMRKMIRG